MKQQLNSLIQVKALFYRNRARVCDNYFVATIDTHTGAVLHYCCLHSGLHACSQLLLTTRTTTGTSQSLHASLPAHHFNLCTNQLHCKRVELDCMVMDRKNNLVTGMVRKGK